MLCWIGTTRGSVPCVALAASASASPSVLVAVSASSDTNASPCSARRISSMNRRALQVGQIAQRLMLDLADLAEGPQQQVGLVGLALVASGRGGYVDSTASLAHGE